MGTVLHRAIVPHQQVVRPPLMAINAGRFHYVIGECGDQRLGFFLIHTFDPDAVIAHYV
jgi:hypothetical protein